MTLETSFPNSTFCTGRSAFDIKEKQEIRYKKQGELNPAPLAEFLYQQN